MVSTIRACSGFRRAVTSSLLRADPEGFEIVEYPDSRKVGAGVADPTSPTGFRRIGLFRAGSGTLDYWEDEPEAG